MPPPGNNRVKVRINFPKSIIIDHPSTILYFNPNPSPIQRHKVFSLHSAPAAACNTLRYQGLAETEAHDPFQGSIAAPRTLKPDSNMSKGAEFGHAQLHIFWHTFHWLVVHEMDLKVKKCDELQSHFPQEVDLRCWFKLDLVK